MRLPDKIFVEFQEIYKNEYGKTIDLEEAKILGTNLLELFGIICGKRISQDNQSGGLKK